MACPSREELEALARGLADPDRAGELYAHLEECAGCRETFVAQHVAAVQSQPADPAATVMLGTNDQVTDSTGEATPGGPVDSETVCFSAVATAIPGYEIIKELYRGGQGIVYLAIQQSTKRKVAIKVVREGPFASRAEKVRFEREVDILAHLRHPNIVTIHDRGTAAGHDYFVMDYISGESLDEWMRCKRPIREKVLLFRRIAEAIGAAHLRGITHRDLKPGNVRVDEEGEPHILDFGLAKAASTADASQMTRTGQFMGSLPWASPEQAEALPDRVDVRSDVYSLGVMLYEMLTGQFPYDVTGNMRDTLDRIITAAPQRPRSLVGEIDRDLEIIVLTSLRKERERRYQNASEFADDLRHWLAGEPIGARRDSVTYLMVKHARRGMQRQALLTTLACLLSIAFLTQYVFLPAIYKWMPFHEWYQRLLTLVPQSGLADFEHVRLVELTDRTDTCALAEAAGLEGVDPTNLRSLRRLHGAFMERIAASGLGVLVWDIAFVQPSEYDEALIRGIRAVRAHGADVVLSVWEWEWDEVPGFTPGILEQAKWGPVTCDYSEELPWSLDLVVQREGHEPAPSLVLTALAAQSKPGAELHVQVNANKPSVTMHHWQPNRTALLPRPRTVGDEVDLTELVSLQEDDDSVGLLRDDLIGQYEVNIPADPVWQRCTLDYQDVFSASQQQLHAWFDGRAVMVCDARSDVDRHPHPDGRVLPGAYAHAAAIEGISRRFSVHTPTDVQGWLVIVAAVVVGGGAGRWLSRSALKLMLCVVLLSIGATGVAVLAYHEVQYLINPLVPILAMLLSALCVYTLRRQAVGSTHIEEA